MRRLHARWVLPISAPPVRDGTVVLGDTTIRWVGPRADAPPGGDDIDLGDAILLPGLVNAHIHLDLAALAGRIAVHAFFPWVRRLVTTLAGVEPSVLREGARWAVADQLRHGVTTMADTAPNRYGFDAMREFGARGVAFHETFGPAPEQCDASMAALRAAVTAMRRDETTLVRAGISPHAPFSVSDALYTAAAGYARAESLPVAVHIAESAAESELVTAAAGPFAAYLREERGIAVAPRASSPVALLERTGVLAARPLCIHAVRAGAADVDTLAAARATVVHCPCSNRWFDHGPAPLAAFRARAVPVGLGTDSGASNTQVRILAEARLAADPSLTPHDRLALATHGGAAALGLGGHVGVLTPGFDADLCAFDITDRAACDADPAAYLLEHAALRPARFAMVAGRDRTVTSAALASLPLPGLP